MLVEDVLETLYKHSGEWNRDEWISDWHHKFIFDVYNNKVQRKLPLSTGQVDYILRIVKICKINLSKILDPNELDQLIQAPVCRFTPYKTIKLVREVRWIGQNLLAFRFKSNDEIKSQLKLLSTQCSFDVLNKLWIVPITSDNLKQIHNVIRHFQFKTDSITKGFLDQCKQNVGRPTRSDFDPITECISIRVIDDEELGYWLKHVMKAANS